MDTNNNKQCECNKPKVVNDLLKRISNLEFEVERLEKEKKQVLDKLNTPLAFTSSYQLNYQSAMLLIEEVKSIWRDKK